MKRSFWTAVLLAITLCGGWTLYVGAQELQKQTSFGSESEPKEPRFQFLEHFFLNQGEPFEIFLRLDRRTGQAWRYHATQPGWSMVKDAASLPAAGEIPDRYELLSHVYRNPDGIQLERMLRVDYELGRSWAYEPSASRWDEIPIEAVPPIEQQAAAPPADAGKDAPPPTPAPAK